MRILLVEDDVHKMNDIIDYISTLNMTIEISTARTICY